MKSKTVLLTSMGVLLIGFLFPESLTMPVEGANQSSYSIDSFWFYPWGKSITHNLHYSIITLFPYVWLADKSVEGWKKIFYLNPIPYLIEADVKNRL
ncbi:MULTISPECIES: hypothetical protein [Leptospira]|uniref:Uncharacterized protein n=1 Tax=Leptospira santarosai TaxID=28183 RepID=A0AB73LMC5_9LEPT|nr:MULTISPECIES: hypothetical protein [Leptospira]AVV49577.1 Uncharacterized protein XB17_00976 [Leptospira santarosai]EKO76474.1 hypothetical protein LEP1GSC068_1537 [Leptospira sp. Fiocruz LV3954]EMI61890.1 hypothetical protein LEP1GSC076_1979 [Leptospira sp. Fiocruz LV4135]MBW9233748.1 hypothetical protein [Leptospira santarosai]MDO6395169.1 hypothetical protein [Leptospira santarosai]